MSTTRRAMRARKPVATPALAVLLALGALLAVAAWATAAPPGVSPDEDFHLTSIWCPTPVDGSCDTRVRDDGMTEVSAPKTVIWAAQCTWFEPASSGACVDDLGDDPVWSSRFDDGEYPGGFYDAMHLFVGDDVAASVTVMRLVNGTLAVTLFAALALLAGAQVRRVMVYGFLVVSVPMVINLVASVNPSGWAFTGVAAAWAAMHGYFVQPSRGKRCALAGLAALAALIAATARADGGAYLGVVAAAVVALHARAIYARWRGLALPVTVAVIGVIGYASAHQGGAVTRGMEATGESGDVGLLVHNVLSVRRIALGVLRDPLNWVDTPVPLLTWLPTTLLVAALVVHGLRRVTWPKVVSLAGLVVVFFGLPLLVLQISDARIGEVVQARYVAPLVPVIVATALWDPVRGRVARLPRWVAAAAFGTLTVGHSLVLHTQIRRYVTGLDVGGLNLDSGAEWWHSPVPPTLTWIVGSLGFAVLCTAFFTVMRPDPANPTDTVSLVTGTEPAPGAVVPAPTWAGAA